MEPTTETASTPYMIPVSPQITSASMKKTASFMGGNDGEKLHGEHSESGSQAILGGNDGEELHGEHSESGSQALTVGNQNSSPPSASPVLILALSCVVIFGLYYLLDLPAPLREHLKENMPTTTTMTFETKYQLLFSVVLFSGIFLPLLGGFVVDRVGGGICLLWLATSCFIGHMIASAGVQRENWAILLAGRFLFGLGVECEIIAIQALMAEDFGKKRVGMALALIVSMAYIGNFSSFLICPVVANRLSLAFAFWLGATINGVSVVAALLIYVLSRKKRPSGEEVASERDTPTPERTSEPASDSKCEKIASLLFSLKFNSLFWLLCISSLLQYSVNATFFKIASGALLERNLFIEPGTNCWLEQPNQCSSGSLAPENGNPLRDQDGAICVLPEKYAPVLPHSINVTTTEPAWDKLEYVFVSLKADDVDCTDKFWSEACTSDFCDEKETATEQAGFLMAIPPIVLVATVFLFGKFGVDRAGLRCEMLLLAPILIFIAQTMFAFLNGSPLVPLILQGLGYSLVSASLWPAIPLTVPESSVGKAFGLAMACQNIGLTVFPLIVAAIYNMHDRYLPEVSIFFLSCTVLSICVALLLLLYDRQTGSNLRVRNQPSAGSVHSTPFLHSSHSTSVQNNQLVENKMGQPRM